MKKSFIILFTSFLFLSFSNSFAQCDLPINENGDYEFSEVVSVDGDPTKEQLYGAAMIALSDAFKSSKDVIQSKDKDLGFVTGKFVTGPYPFSMGIWESKFNFSFRLDFKNGKYRITINYLGHEAYSSASSCSCPNDITKEKCGKSCVTKKQWNRQRCASHNDILNLVEVLEKKIIKNITTDSDW